MKKIELSLTQTGTEDFVAQFAIAARVGGKFTKAAATDIFLEAVEKNAHCTYSAYFIEESTMKVVVKTKSGGQIIRYFKDKNDVCLDRHGFVIKGGKSPEEINDFLKSLAGFIKEVEEAVFEAHKVTKNYTFIAV